MLPGPQVPRSTWGNEPVNVQSSKRANVSLNGAWKFSPALTGAQSNQAPQQGWGYMAVPGNWRRHQEMIAQGHRPAMDGLRR
jgi:hypothetical protein